MNVHFGMKAAALSSGQLEDRILKFHRLSLKPIIELHLFGEADLLNKSNREKCCLNCKSVQDGNLIFFVHIPQEESPGKLFDPFYNDTLFDQTLDFADQIGAKAIIMHRGCCYDTGIPHNEAQAFFNDFLFNCSSKAARKKLSILLENYGHIWLGKGGSSTGPLDHFFPWEIKNLKLFLKNNNIDNVFPFIDVAHAALSINMLELYRSYPDLRNDYRFSYMPVHDLNEKSGISIQNFITESCPPYLHISDSILYEGKKEPDDLDIYFKSEGMPLGAGNLDFEKILSAILKINRDIILIMEINPADNNHENNKEQYRAVILLQNLLNNITSEAKNK